MSMTRSTAKQATPKPRAGGSRLTKMVRYYMGATAYPAYIHSLNPLTITVDMGNKDVDLIVPPQELTPYEDLNEEHYTVQEMRVVRVPDNPNQEYTDQHNSKEVPMLVGIPKVKRWRTTRPAQK